MLDTSLKAWLMEINANPSLNMFLEKEGADGEINYELSPLDKFLKTKVLTDALNIAKAKNPKPEDYGSFTKILPADESEYSKYYIFEEAR